MIHAHLLEAGHLERDLMTQPEHRGMESLHEDRDVASRVAPITQTPRS